MPYAIWRIELNTRDLAPRSYWFIWNIWIVYNIIFECFQSYRSKVNHLSEILQGIHIRGYSFFECFRCFISGPSKVKPFCGSLFSLLFLKKKYISSYSLDNIDGPKLLVGHKRITPFYARNLLHYDAGLRLQNIFFITYFILVF